MKDKKIEMGSKRLGFALQLCNFRGWNGKYYTWIKYKWNEPHKCWAVKCCHFEELFMDWNLEE